jgi:hypothetical protein
MDLYKELRKVGYYMRIEFCRFIHEFYSNLNNSGIRDKDVNIIDIKFYNEEYEKRCICLDNGAIFYLDVNLDVYWVYEYKGKEHRFNEAFECFEFIEENE